MIFSSPIILYETFFPCSIKLTWTFSEYILNKFEAYDKLL